jgi:aspartyl-tRNA(Asn)/glutamyl-tRNA(Gln) amidotransferase subunit C
MDVTPELIEQLAKLARLRLDARQVERLADDFEQILDYVSKLDELDVSEVEPTTHAVPLEVALRDDVAELPFERDEILDAAPDTEDGHFRVPRVVDE